MRDRQRLLIGPWNHGGMARGNPIGDYDFGMRATGAVHRRGRHPTALVRPLAARHRQRHRRREPPVRLFVMGANVGGTSRSGRSRAPTGRSGILHSGGRANTLNGDGALSRESPAQRAARFVRLQPAQPRADAWAAASAATPSSRSAAPTISAPIEAREDVLVYTTPPLEQPVEVTGPVKLILHASTARPTPTGRRNSSMSRPAATRAT